MFSAEGAGQEEEQGKHLETQLSLVTPDSSVEMGLTSLAVKMASRHPEDSMSSVVSSSSVLERTTFLSDVCLCCPT